MSELITSAFLMVGGEGRRLKPYTNQLPKPMIDVHGVPLLELIIRKLQSYGIKKFYLSVNYLSHIIEDYFGDGSRIGTEIVYIKEPFGMGTAGSLSLLENIEKPFLLMNGDIYTDLDFRDFFVGFRHSNADMFICCQRHVLESAYGSLELYENEVVSWKEKPRYNQIISCGIYILNPTVISLVPKGHFFGMNHLVDRLIEQHRSVKTYEMKDAIWIDIGTVSEYNRLLVLTENT